MDAPHLVTRLAVNRWILGEDLPLLSYRICFYYDVQDICPFSHLLMLRIGLPMPPEPSIATLRHLHRSQALLDWDIAFTCMGPFQHQAHLLWYDWTTEPSEAGIELHIAVPGSKE